jgi:hypothetical protein
VNRVKAFRKMSAKDKENKTFHEKVKQFFRIINKGGAGKNSHVSFYSAIL